MIVLAIHPRRLSLVTMLLLVVGCSDDPMFPLANDPGGADAGAEGQPDPCNASANAEAGWTCAEIGDCTTECGIDTGCIDACKAQGCESAVTAFNTVSDCVAGQCLSDCLDGFSAACESCANEKCGAQNAACEAQTCGDTASDECQTDDDDDDDDSPPDDPAPAGANCLSIVTCKSECDFTDFACPDACDEGICEEAQTAASDLEECSLFNCAFDCFEPEDPSCAECVADSCADAISTCAATACS